MNADQVTGLRKAHQLLKEVHEELLREESSTPRILGFIASRRHMEISGASKALVELSDRMVGMALGKPAPSPGITKG